VVKYIQLNRQFDTAAMQQEVTDLLNRDWQQHYNSKHYEGDWSVLPLRSMDGQIENPYSISPRNNPHIQYADTPLLQEAPYLKSVLDFFQCEKTSVRLMRLKAGSVIKEHTDQEINFENGEARIHIPVFTNSGVAFYVAGEQVVMQEGECWYLNLSLRHRVTNGGTTDRIHLVMDCIVNEWLQSLLLEQHRLLKETSEQDLQPVHTEDEKKKIIEQLRSMNTPVALELANKMENE
jgi:Aspartyl/Asparaginyl beta-hydroxylase